MYIITNSKNEGLVHYNAHTNTIVFGDENFIKYKTYEHANTVKNMLSRRGHINLTIK